MSVNVSKLQEQIAETSKRFANRQPERQSAERSLERQDLRSANGDELLRERIKHLDLSDEVKSEMSSAARGQTDLRSESMDSRAVIEAAVLERLLGKNDLMPIHYLSLGLDRARTVGRIVIRNSMQTVQGYGTGFLVSPRLLMTNNHVLEKEGDAVHSQFELDYEFIFGQGMRPAVQFPLDPATFFFTDKNLDFTIVALGQRTDGREPREWGWNKLREEPGLIVKGEAVTVIQHPNGEAKQIALRENLVIDLLEQFAHYRTDTSPGSSGSPVFNDQWEVVALHHSGVPEKHPDGGFMALDGRKWEPWMGDHRIKWIANEGVMAASILKLLKNKELGSNQKRLLTELLESEPPSSPRETRDTGSVVPVVPSQQDRQPRTCHATPMFQQSAHTATWTVPLQIRVSLGSPASDGGVPAVKPAPPAPVAPPPRPPEEDLELQDALQELEAAKTRTYYDAGKDAKDKKDYYEGIDVANLKKEQLFKALSERLQSTHHSELKYKPSTHVYPWVDLQEDLKLKSIYSGDSFEPEELIREDFRIHQDRERLLSEVVQREGVLSEERLAQEVDLLESQNPFNCEHVVPQSWFEKREPMRGDLHHLFACESGCNSFRSNLAYFDFADFEEALRDHCGKREKGRFEPGHGKGAVARATLYFLLRYPGEINLPSETPDDWIKMLLQWHSRDEVTVYERHRNQAIFAKQGNRNPLIDHPKWASKIAFELGM